MSSFIQDNIDRFNKIHADYNNIANSIGNLTKRSPDDDLKSKVETAGSGVESAANLYLEGRKMIHELKGRKLQKGLAGALKEAGQRNAEHLVKNNQLLGDVLDKIKNQGARDSTLSTGGEDNPDRVALNQSLKQRYKALPEDVQARVSKAAREDPRFKATPQTEDELKQNLQVAKENIEKAEGTPAAGTPPRVPQAQAGETPPTAPTPAPRAGAIETQTAGAAPRPAESVESTDTDDTALSLQQPRQLSQSRGRVATDDAPASSEGSAGRNLAGGAARTAESETSSAARTASTVAETSEGMETAGGVLDAIPGLDLLGLALGAIGGVTSAVAGAIPDKEPEAPAPKKAPSIGGNFSQQAVEQGGTTA